jgi:hypothetical protein
LKSSFLKWHSRMDLSVREQLATNVTDRNMFIVTRTVHKLSGRQCMTQLSLGSVEEKGETVVLGSVEEKGEMVVLGSVEEKGETVVFGVLKSSTSSTLQADVQNGHNAHMDYAPVPSRPLNWYILLIYAQIAHNYNISLPVP